LNFSKALEARIEIAVNCELRGFCVLQTRTSHQTTCYKQRPFYVLYQTVTLILLLSTSCE